MQGAGAKLARSVVESTIAHSMAANHKPFVAGEIGQLAHGIIERAVGNRGGETLMSYEDMALLVEATQVWCLENQFGRKVE